MSVRILIGDCRDWMVQLEPNSLDACVCDPPYHLTSIVKRFGAENAAPAKVGKTGAYERASRGFMGQTWDGGDVAFDPATWEAVYRVLKPGAHLIAFSGTRTYHRMACAIEDAGFEIRDQLAWCYGSGFPKSHNQSGEWEGWGTALKPAWEPICLARKPLIGTVAGNLAKHGTGALNIDGCRVPTDEQLRAGAGVIPMRHDPAVPRGRDGESSATRRYQTEGATNFAALPGPRGGDPLGRWPANIIHDGSDEVLAAFPDAPGQIATVKGTEPSSPFANVYGDMPNRAGAATPRGDSGSAARFFQECSYGEDEWQKLVSLGLVAKCADSQCDLCGTPIAGVPAGTKTSDSKSEGSPVGQGSTGSCSASIPTRSHAPDAENPESTGTTRTTASSSKSNGSATVATAPITRLENGEKVEDANGRVLATRFLYCPKATTEERGEGNNHPTVKPIDLMRWLCRLITPPGGTVLDPFMGSGSTLIAADAEQFDAIGCELSPEYAAIAERRIRDAAGLFAEVQTEALGAAA